MNTKWGLRELRFLGFLSDLKYLANEVLANIALEVNRLQVFPEEHSEPLELLSEPNYFPYLRQLFLVPGIEGALLK